MFVVSIAMVLGELSGLGGHRDSPSLLDPRGALLVRDSAQDSNRGQWWAHGCSPSSCHMSLIHGNSGRGSRQLFSSLRSQTPGKQGTLQKACPSTGERNRLKYIFGISGLELPRQGLSRVQRISPGEGISEGSMEDGDADARAGFLG